jgi:hypothetical protein
MTLPILDLKFNTCVQARQRKLRSLIDSPVAIGIVVTTSEKSY